MKNVLKLSLAFFILWGVLISCNLSNSSYTDSKELEIQKLESALPESVKLYSSYVVSGKAIDTPLVDIKLSDGSTYKVYSKTEFLDSASKAEYESELENILNSYGIQPDDILLKKGVDYSAHYNLQAGVGCTVECRWEWAFWPFTTYRKLFFQFDDSHTFYRLRMTHRRTSSAFHIFVDSNSTTYDKSWGSGGQSMVDAHCKYRAAWDNPWWDYNIDVWYKVGSKSYYNNIYHRK